MKTPKELILNNSGFNPEIRKVIKIEGASGKPV